MAAAALQYSRTRLLAVVGAARMGRFVMFGSLAMLFGGRILKMGAESHRARISHRADRHLHYRKHRLGLRVD
jgi:hypothetical protein